MQVKTTMKLSKALFLSVTLINACTGERSLEADVHSCACEAIEFEFAIDCEDTATVSCYDAYVAKFYCDVFILVML